MQKSEHRSDPNVMPSKHIVGRSLLPIVGILMSLISAACAVVTLVLISLAIYETNQAIKDFEKAGDIYEEIEKTWENANANINKSVDDISK